MGSVSQIATSFDEAVCEVMCTHWPACGRWPAVPVQAIALRISRIVVVPNRQDSHFFEHVAQNQVSLTVDATMDIYRSGGYNDSSDGLAPVVYPEYSADDETSGYCVASAQP